MIKYHEIKDQQELDKMIDGKQLAFIGRCNYVFRAETNWNNYKHLSYLIVCLYYATYAFTVKLPSVKLLARSWHNIWNLSTFSGNRTYNQLACKWTFNHLATLAKLLGVRLRTNWLLFHSGCSHLNFFQ